MGSDSIVTLTHSLTQKDSIVAYASIGSKLQKNHYVSVTTKYALIFSTANLLLRNIGSCCINHLIIEENDPLLLIVLQKTA